MIYLMNLISLSIGFDKSFFVLWLYQVKRILISVGSMTNAWPRTDIFQYDVNNRYYMSQNIWR